jgi:FAD dependent oxidoreductase/HYDIN/CFA65/VesB family protein/putative pyrroloquinoline-quinone-binding quinoprotein
VLERESELGTHQTGHNSGVIHAGLYYPPGSLKARLCGQGARELYDYCAQRGIPSERSGKIVIATHPSELDRLDELERRATANRVPGLRRLDAAAIAEMPRRPAARRLRLLRHPPRPARPQRPLPRRHLLASHRPPRRRPGRADVRDGFAIALMGRMLASFDPGDELETGTPTNTGMPGKGQSMRTMRAAPALCTLLLLVFAARALGAEITNSGGDLRTGWYPGEASITPQLVGGGSFGRLWSTPVKGQVYAQPLLDGGTLLVATEENNLYGLDPSTGAKQWSANLGEPWNPGELGCGDLAPDVGVTSTPVIDPASNIAYLTYKTYRPVAGGSGSEQEPVWYMDAVHVSTGAQVPGFPVPLEGTAQNAPGQSFHPQTELQRPGLLLMEGVVYAAFGSDCDHPVWQGWVFGVSTAGAVRARWVADETGEGAGIWQSGAGLTSDRPGSILLSTGNGGAPEAPTPGDTPPPDLGESIVRLQVQPDGSLQAIDFFAPFDAASLDAWDADFASGGVTGLPEEYFGTPAIPHLAVAVGKDGYVYLLNRDDLGGIGQGPSGSDDVVQRIGPYGGVWSRPGVWPGEGGWVYIPTASGGESASGSAGNLRVYKYGLSGTGTPTLSLQATSAEAFGFSSSAPVITSSGIAPGSALVWIVWAPNGSGEGAQLRAYDPIPVHGEPVLLWSAPIGTSSKFALPGVGAGRLYVGTRDGHVLAFGSPVTPALTGSTTDFPTTTIGSSSNQTLTLTATEPLTLSSLASSSSQFTLGTPSTPLPATLSQGQTIEVPIAFSPTGTGPIGATLTATTSTGRTATFGLSGTGQATVGKIEATPPLVSFGGTSVGETLSAGATFRNVGAAPLEIKGVRLPSAPFSAGGVPALKSTIAPGQSITITVNFQPSAVGNFSGEIELETTGGNEAVGLSGSAALPGALQIAGEALDYGPVPIGTTQTESFTVTNTGGTAVTITKSKPPSGGAFAATTSLSEGTTIAPGASVSETVAFTPTVAGPASAVWTINGEHTTGVHEVRFSGVGVLPESPPPAEPPVLGAPPVTPEPHTPPESHAPAESQAPAASSPTVAPAALVTPLGGTSPFTETREPLLRLGELLIRAKASKHGGRTREDVLTYTLSTAGKVELTISRRVISHRCLLGAGTCEHWTPTKIKLVVAGGPGSNTLTLDLAALAGGHYRLDATPIARSGAARTTRYVHFQTAG